MSNDKKIIILERIGQQKDIVKIRFTEEVKSQTSIVYIVAAINKCFQSGYSRLIIDMGQIDLPHNTFIATLIEATSKVRRKAGDIKIINMSEEARNIISGFNALSYLTVET